MSPWKVIAWQKAFDDLQRQLHQLSDKKIMIDDMEYQRLEN